MIKILCVDDDAISLMICKTAIKNAGLSEEVITASNGEDAIEYYANFTKNLESDSNDIYPRLIFLDLNMPIIDGWEFLDDYMNLYYEKFKDTKVVILSSSVDPQDKERAKKYPIVIDFYSKPISQKILKEIQVKLNQNNFL